GRPGRVRLRRPAGPARLRRRFPRRPLVAHAAALRRGRSRRRRRRPALLRPRPGGRAGPRRHPAARGRGRPPRSRGRRPPRRATAAPVDDVLDRPDPVAAPARPAALPAGPYGLRVRGLRARYRPDAPDALRGADFELRPGERALVTGPSGCGKSTLAAVLLRL